MDGFLTSPGYPRSYPPLTECTVTVVALPGGRIRIQLIDLQLSHYRSAADSADHVICADRLLTNTVLALWTLTELIC